jgi:hypothetical protein
VLSATRVELEKQGLDVKGGKVEDIATGTVLMELGGAKSGRLAALHAGSVLGATGALLGFGSMPYLPLHLLTLQGCFF